MGQHSTSHMGKLRDGATFHGSTEVVKISEIPKEEMKGVSKGGAEGHSYLNEALRKASQITDQDAAIKIDRSWPNKSTASTTASHIRNAVVSGPHFGKKNEFQTITIIDDRAEGLEWTVAVRPPMGRPRKRGSWY